MTKENPRRSQPSQRRRRSSPPSSRLRHPQSLPMPVGQTKIGINHGHRTKHGWYSSHETSSTGQALMAFHDAYEHHEKEAIHGKLIQSDTVSEHNLSVATNHSLLATKLMAPVINLQHNPTYAILDNGCTRSMGSWHAIQRFTQAIEPMKDIISYQYIPAETKFTFANRETARVNWTLHLGYHTTPLCSTNIDVLEQGTVPILLSTSQMRNLYMTIEHTDKQFQYPAQDTHSST